ncbi:phage tail protein, partial [Escherichia coli]|nr:phage tail protein [Escherichia coli]
GDNQVKGIPLKLVRGRVRMLSASPAGKMYARIRVNRGNLPAIKLSTTRRRAGDGLRVGKYFFQGAFIRQLANGRWHVLKRLPEARFATGRDHQGRPKKNRLPVAVVKIPLAGPLTQAFGDVRNRIIAEEMPKQLGYALKQQLRSYLNL